MNYLSLFSGIGGMDLGLDRAGMRCVGQVEIDPYCRRVLAKHWPDVPRFDDIKTFNPKVIREKISLVAGGFPCQDISCANHGGRGIDGEKSGLWREMFRVICDVRPLYVIVENVANLLNRGIGTVLGDLASIRFDAEWEVLPAHAFGADIERERVFIVAFAEQVGRQGILCGELGERVAPHPAWGAADSLDTPSARLERVESWLREPALLGSTNGISQGVFESELGAYGNAVVPQVAEWIGRRIMEAARQERVA